MSLRTDLERVAKPLWRGERVGVKPIETQDELLYALFFCRLTEEQQALVNPAGFSIGRAYLYPADNVPCLVYDERNEPVGFIQFAKWLGEGDAYTWSFFIGTEYQGQGYGKCAARLAVNLLKTANPAMPIKLATEKDNEPAQRLYRSLGFLLLPETDGDDLVFGLS